MKRKYLSIIFATILILSISAISEKSKLDLTAFDGKWEGEGTYYLPFTSIPTSIDGTAMFKYDSARKFLRTELTAERFLFKYSDSGRMSYGKNQDSLIWDIWNSFGYYVRYTGGVKGKTIHGIRKWGKYTYDLYIDVVSDDSIKIKITSTDSDGDSSEVAKGYLRRSKEKSN